MISTYGYTKRTQEKQVLKKIFNIKYIYKNKETISLHTIKFILFLWSQIVKDAQHCENSFFTVGDKTEQLNVAFTRTFITTPLVTINQSIKIWSKNKMIN